MLETVVMSNFMRIFMRDNVVVMRAIVSRAIVSLMLPVLVGGLSRARTGVVRRLNPSTWNNLEQVIPDLRLHLRNRREIEIERCCSTLYFAYGFDFDEWDTDLLSIGDT